jgi:hypothetical protein
LIEEMISIFFVEILRTMGGLERFVEEAVVETSGFGGVVVERIVGEVVLRSDEVTLC